MIKMLFDCRCYIYFELKMIKQVTWYNLTLHWTKYSDRLNIWFTIKIYKNNISGYCYTINFFIIIIICERLPSNFCPKVRLVFRLFWAADSSDNWHTYLYENRDQLLSLLQKYLYIWRNCSPSMDWTQQTLLNLSDRLIW